MVITAKCTELVTLPGQTGLVDLLLSSALAYFYVTALVWLTESPDAFLRGFKAIGVTLVQMPY